jgi:diguanylate cyclase (GGDEF)-like protein
VIYDYRRLVLINDFESSNNDKLVKDKDDLGLGKIVDILSEKTRLPSPPKICIKILDLVRNDDFSFQELARIISADPSLTAKLLKVVNTPYYNRSGHVPSVEKAVAILGVKVTKLIVLSFAVYTEFQIEGNDAFDIDLFWRRSLTSAVAAEQIATSVIGSNNDLFLIGLLQDIGIVIMHNWRPNEYQQACKGSSHGQTSQLQLENDYFGFDHQILGAELFKSWNFPEEIYQPIRYHHANDSPPQEYRIVIDILEVANLISSFYNGSHDIVKIRRAQQLLTTKFGFEEHVAVDLIESVAHKSGEIFASFEISSEEMKPFSLILQDANEELSKLYHSYEIMLLELKQEKEKTDFLAKELYEANERLRELVYIDALTKVYNYRFFQDALNKEIVRSQRYGREFSLLLFDIDEFKKINDEHGHLVGSEILINISRLVQKKVRNTDIFARVGGDEFGVILPETNISKASLVAEKIRHSIEVSNTNVPVTISIGLTNYCSEKGDWDNSVIFNKTDEALYAAKKNGRNQVCIV